MTTRDRAPLGAPCWTDLWTSDVDGSRAFYSSLLGWEALEPSPEFGGYFMFSRDGVPVAGCMGDMGDDMPANDTWKIYLATEDMTATAQATERQGGQIISPAMPVADLGIQFVFTDPTGADLGAWQPGTFPGFTVLDEPGTPSWFELYTRDYGAAVDFYRTVFPLEAVAMSDTDEFRYTTLSAPGDSAEVAGIMDAADVLPEGIPSHWAIYWEVADVDAAAATTGDLGGTVVDGPSDTPYGRMATVTDPAGAQFKLRTGPK
jgi:uncharacterized protein